VTLEEVDPAGEYGAVVHALALKHHAVVYTPLRYSPFIALGWRRKREKGQTDMNIRETPQTGSAHLVKGFSVAFLSVSEEHMRTHFTPSLQKKNKEIKRREKTPSSLLRMEENKDEGRLHNTSPVIGRGEENKDRAISTKRKVKRNNHK
jgi:hypothetical protein